MTCTNCNHLNDGGKFCEKCGTALLSSQSASVEAAASASLAEPAGNQQHQYIEGAKNISKTYFTYFLQVIKKPYASSVGVGSEHFVNGIITLALYAILIPLMLYFAFKGVLADMGGFGGEFLGEFSEEIQPSFTDIVLKPILAYAIFIMLVATFTFSSVRIGGSIASYKEVVARFGSFQIPFVAILAIGLIMSILKIDLFFFFLFLGFIGSVFLVPPLVIASFKQNLQLGFDVLYGSLLTYVLSFIAIWIMGDMLFEALKSYFMNLIEIFNY